MAAFTGTVVTVLSTLERQELARTATALMSFRPTVLPSAASRKSNNTSDADEQNGITPSLPKHPHSLPVSPIICHTKSCPMDNVGLPRSPEAVQLHPNQFAFLTSVGEMARRLARKQGECADGRMETDGTQLVSCAESAPPHHELQLSVDTLVHTEGQRVRLRFVPSVPECHQGSNKNLRGLTKDKRGKGACQVYRSRHGAAFSLCTILSSFAPPKASYWQDDRLVEPYLGKCCGPSTQRRRSNWSDENNGIEYDDDGGSGALDEEHNCNSFGDDVSCLNDDPEDNMGSNESPNLCSKRRGAATVMRSYGKMLTHNRCRSDPVFHNAFFLDTGNITGGERRKKLIVLHSYRASVISFVDKKVLKKDINNDFYVQHPELEIREIKLTHMRKIRADLLNFALEDNSPIEVVTVAYANWYFERLIMRGMVGKRNRRLVLAACILLAMKFIETGDIHKKIHYAKTRFRQDEAFAGVTWQKVQEWEFRAYVGLEFTLMPDRGSTVVETHVERLLGQINLTSEEYYSKKFALP